MRRHVVDGQETIVIHDEKTGGLVTIGPREWGLLTCADGTRDLEGILLAAAREGAHARAPMLRAFLNQLGAAGLLASDPGGAAESAESCPADRPLSVLSDFRLRCDGRGGCCRQYASMLFSPVEAARARATLPLVQSGGERSERVFSPERGALPHAGSAVAMIDGRCAYLASDDRCGLHVAEGPLAKPLGCRLFPATFVDDGDEVRVSVAIECACVLSSLASGDEGAPIVSKSARFRGDLDDATFVSTLPSEIAIAPPMRAPRAEVAAWSKAIATRLANDEGDIAAIFWSLANACEEHGVDGAHAISAIERPVAASMSDVAPWIAALRKRATRRVTEDAAWRSERDLARRTTRWIALACEAITEGSAATDALDRSREERLYARAAIHGHHLLGDAPLAMALRDRAIRVLVARAMAPLAEAAGVSDEAACAHPLASLEAMLRGHGLDAYAHEIEEN